MILLKVFGKVEEFPVFPVFQQLPVSLAESSALAIAPEQLGMRHAGVLAVQERHEVDSVSPFRTDRLAG